MTDSKYKKWGWGAIIGLVGVIVVAGLVIAVTMASPKPNKGKDVVANKPAIETSKEEPKEQPKEEPKEENKPVENERPKIEDISGGVKTEIPENSESFKGNNSADKLPTTGPASTAFATVMTGVTVYLVALNLSFLKKRN